MVTLVNRAKVATATTGTGTITLGSAESGYQTFADAGLTGSDTIRYTIEDGDAWEIGTGGLNAAVSTMSRTLIESSTGAKLSLSGDAVVYVTAAGQDIVQPSDLATVATTGAYSDLSGLPTLGTAAATDATAYATAAQGALADSAVQPNDSPSFGSVTVTGTVDGRDVAADGSKLDGIEAGATADQTAGEIKTAYESNANTNAYTDAEKSKLAGIEAGATADQTASEILTSIKTVDGSGSGLDADLLDGIHASSFLQGNQTITLSGDVSGSGTTSISVTVADDSHNHVISNVDGLQAALDAKLDDSQKGAANGLAELDATGKVPSAQLPSYVDDVLEYANAGSFPATGEAGKLYVALDSNDVYRWTGSAYVKVSDAVSTADQATKLATARNIALSGDVSGSANFDGSANISITATVADDSHNHIIGNVDGLQAALDGKLSTTGKAADSNLLDGLDSTAFYLASNPNGYTANLGDITGVTAGGGITGGGTSGTVTVSHADTSAQASVNNSGATVIQDVTLDTYGHVTALGSKTLTAADVGAITGNQTITLSGDVSGSGTTSISVTVADDSHNHIIANVDGLQTALDEKWSKGADIGGGVNLNTYTTDGYYHQNSNANATSGSNYPVALAGMLEVTSDGSMVYQRYTTYNSVHTVYVRTYYSGTWYNWAKQWDNLNDGSGSGLDADLLDGQQGSYYYPASNPNGYTAYTNSDVDTHLNTGTATTDQVLSWNGTDYDWVDGGGAPPTDLHAVGTYTVACTGVNVAQGGTTAGSNLRYRNIYALDRFTVLTTTSSTVTLTGTWRNVGGPVQYASGRGGGSRGVSLWVRIS